MELYGLGGNVTIEEDVSVPTVLTVSKIATAMGVPVERVIAESEPVEDKVFSAIGSTALSSLDEM